VKLSLNCLNLLTTSTSSYLFPPKTSITERPLVIIFVHLLAKYFRHHDTEAEKGLLTNGAPSCLCALVAIFRGYPTWDLGIFRKAFRNFSKYQYG